MASRRKFLQQGGVGLLSALALPAVALSESGPAFDGLIVNDQEGEAVRMRAGTSVVRIKISKSQGSNSLCFLSESITPGDVLPVHKHSNEDELIFIHKGSGLFTLGEQVTTVGEGAVMLVPKGTWHGLQNTGRTHRNALCVHSFRFRRIFQGGWDAGGAAVRAEDDGGAARHCQEMGNAL